MFNYFNCDILSKKGDECMSKILYGTQLEKFKERFFSDEKDIFSIILSIDSNIVHCYINGERKIDFDIKEVESYL